MFISYRCRILFVPRPALPLKELPDADRVARREPVGPARLLRRHRAGDVRVSVQEVQAGERVRHQEGPPQAALLDIPHRHPYVRRKPLPGGNFRDREQVIRLEDSGVYWKVT